MILTDWYEPGFKAGGPIQSCRNFVAAMHELYEISVITGDRDLGDAVAYPGIQTGQWIERSPGIKVYYASKKTLKPALMKDLIHSRQPDFIYLNSVYSPRFSILPMFLLWRKKISAVFVMAPRGMLQAGAVKFKPIKKKLFIYLLNGLGIPAQMNFHATDDQERKDILRRFPRAARVDVIPNFSGGIPARGLPLKKIPGQLRCVYISRITPKKNILFFLKLLNLVSDDTQLEFTIYGEVDEEKYWQQSQSVMHFLPKNIAVLYRGPLPHDQVIPALEANHVFILPSKGENYGHAIFEAFSAGRPCMISDKTPWKGLKQVGTGWALSLEKMEDWIAALQEIADYDQAEFDAQSERCRQFARDHQEGSDLEKEYINLFS